MDGTILHRVPWDGVATLSNGTLVARAITKKAWISEGKFLPSIFSRRPDYDTDGITVTNPKACTSEQLCATFRGVCLAVIHLQVGQVRAIGLDVEADFDPLAHPCDHASITGLPYRDDDPDLFEDLARKLLKISVSVWP